MATIFNKRLFGTDLDPEIKNKLIAKQYLAKQEQISADMNKLEAEKQNALREVNKLRNTFAKHDLDNLALNKPGLIEKIVNKGTKQVMTDLVELTTVKEDETATN